MGSFFGDEFMYFGTFYKINLSTTGAESQNSLGVGEFWRYPLRISYRKKKLEYFELNWDLPLTMSVKVMKCTRGSEGSFPYSLAKVVLPQVISVDDDKSNHPIPTRANSALD